MLWGEGWSPSCGLCGPSTAAQALAGLSHPGPLPASLTSQKQAEKILSGREGGGDPSPSPPLSASSPAPRAQIVVTFPVKCLVISEAISAENAAAAPQPAFPFPGAEGTGSSPRRGREAARVPGLPHQPCRGVLVPGRWGPLSFSSALPHSLPLSLSSLPFPSSEFLPPEAHRDPVSRSVLQA